MRRPADFTDDFVAVFGEQSDKKNVLVLVILGDPARHMGCLQHTQQAVCGSGGIRYNIKMERRIIEIFSTASPRRFERSNMLTTCLVIEHWVVMVASDKYIGILQTRGNLLPPDNIYLHALLRQILASKEVPSKFCACACLPGLPRFTCSPSRVFFSAI